MIYLFFTFVQSLNSIEIKEINDQIYTHVLVKGKASSINLNNVFQNEMIGAVFELDEKLTNFYQPIITKIQTIDISSCKKYFYSQEIKSLCNQQFTYSITSNSFIMLTNQDLQYGLLQNNGMIDLSQSSNNTLSTCFKIFNITQMISFILCQNNQNFLNITIIDYSQNQDQIFTSYELNNIKIQEPIEFLEIKGFILETDIIISLNYLIQNQQQNYQITISQDKQKQALVKIVKMMDLCKQIITLNELTIILYETQVKIFNNEKQLIVQKEAQEQEIFLKMTVEYQLNNNLTILILSNKQLQMFELNLRKEIITVISHSPLFELLSNIVQLGFNKQFIYLLYQTELRIYQNNKMIDFLAQYKLINAIDCIFQKERNILIVAQNIDLISQLISFQIGQPQIILTEQFSEQINLKEQLDKFYVKAQLRNILRFSYIEFNIKENDFDNDPIFFFKNPYPKFINDYEDIILNYNNLIQGQHKQIQGSINPIHLFKMKLEQDQYKIEKNNSTQNSVYLCSQQYPFQIYCVYNDIIQSTYISFEFLDSFLNIYSLERKDSQKLLGCQCMIEQDSLHLNVLLQYKNEISLIRTNRNLDSFTEFNYQYNKHNIISVAIIQSTAFCVLSDNTLRAITFNGIIKNWGFPKKNFTQIFTNYISYPNLLFLVSFETIFIAQINQKDFLFEIINEIPFPIKVDENSLKTLGVVENGLFICFLSKKSSQNENIQQNENFNNQELTREQNLQINQSWIYFYPKFSLFIKKQEHYYFNLDLQEWNFTEQFLTTITYSQQYMYAILEKKDKKKKCLFIFQGAQNSYSLKVNIIQQDSRYDIDKISTIIYPSQFDLKEILLLQRSDEYTLLYSFQKPQIHFIFQNILEEQVNINANFTIEKQYSEQSFINQKIKNLLQNNKIQFYPQKDISIKLTPIGVMSDKNYIYILTNEMLYQMDQNTVKMKFSFSIKCKYLFYDQLSSLPFAICFDQTIQLLIFNTNNEQSYLHNLDENIDNIKSLINAFYKNSILQIIWRKGSIFKKRDFIYTYIIQIKEETIQVKVIDIFEIDQQIDDLKFSDIYFQSSQNYTEVPCQIIGVVLIESKKLYNTPFFNLLKFCISNDIAQWFDHTTKYSDIETNRVSTTGYYLEFNENNKQLLNQIVQIGDSIKMKNGGYVLNCLLQFSETPVIYQFEFLENLEYFYYKKLCNLREFYIHNQSLNYKIIVQEDGNIIGNTYDGQNVNYFLYSNPQQSENCQRDINFPLSAFYSQNKVPVKYLFGTGSYLLSFDSKQISILQIVNMTKNQIEITNQSKNNLIHFYITILVILIMNLISIFCYIFIKVIYPNLLKNIIKDNTQIILSDPSQIEMQSNAQYFSQQ